MLGKSRHLNALDARRHRKVQMTVGTVVILLLIALVLAAGFYWGQRAAYSGMGLDRDTYRSMAQQLPGARAQISILQRELDMRTTRHKVDRGALEMVRSEIATQQEQISELQEWLGFYRSLMAPGELGPGLSLRPIELVGLDQQLGRYSFRIVAQQEALKHTLLKGELSAELVGVFEGEQVSYPLAELSEDLGSSQIPLRFRYFQVIQGELNLPPGFEPDHVDVMAKANSPRKMEVRESYPWQLQEKFTHVGN